MILDTVPDEAYFSMGAIRIETTTAHGMSGLPLLEAIGRCVFRTLNPHDLNDKTCREDYYSAVVHPFKEAYSPWAVNK